MSKMQKLELICEECGFETDHLEIHKTVLLCNDCAEANKRRQRFLDEEEEWNRGVDQKDAE